MSPLIIQCMRVCVHMTPPLTECHRKVQNQLCRHGGFWVFIPRDVLKPAFPSVKCPQAQQFQSPIIACPQAE